MTRSTLWGPVVLGAAYPKTGNTMIGEGIVAAGQELDATSQQVFDIYRLEEAKTAPGRNAALSAQAPLAYIKTHAVKPFHGFPHAAACEVVKCIRITRNPLDTLLSYINYTRVVVSRAPGNEIPQHIARYIAGDLGLDIRKLSKQTWVEQINLDVLKQQGALETALRSFSAKQLVIPSVYGFAGSWSGNFLSWAAPGVDVFTTYFERFTADKEREVTRLAESLGIDSALLHDGFSAQQKQVSERQSGEGKSKLFFNKAKANYFGEYFERASITRFIDSHWPTLHLVGYQTWCEQTYYAR